MTRWRTNVVAAALDPREKHLLKFCNEVGFPKDSELTRNGNVTGGNIPQISI